MSSETIELEAIPNYDPDQLTFIEQPNRSCRLIGIPGAGKTSTLIGRIQYLHKNGIVPKKCGFLILTYSKAACKDIITKSKKLGCGKLLNIRNVKTIHSIAGTICTRNCSKKSSIDTVIVRATEILKTTTPEKLKSTVSELENVAAIFVDECQDLNQFQFEFVKTLESLLQATLTMIGDPNQSIYQFQGSSSEYLINHSNIVFALTRNYRSTPEIVRLVCKSQPNVYLESDMIAALPVDPNRIPERPILLSMTENSMYDDIVKRIREFDLANETVAVIGPVKFSHYNHNCPVSIGLQSVLHILEKNDIPFLVHYKIATKDGGAEYRSVTSVDGRFSETGRVHLLTIHTSKGLEFDRVLLINYHYYTMNHVPRNTADYEALQNLWYVGKSRAKKSLVIYKLDGKVTWPDFVNKGLGEHCDVFGKIGHAPTFKLNNHNILPARYAWTDMLNNKLVLNEQCLATLEDICSIESVPIKTSDQSNPAIDLPEFEDLATLYGCWAEQMFYYFYRRREPPVLHKIKEMYENMYIVSGIVYNEAEYACKLLGLRLHDGIPIQVLSTHRARLEYCGKCKNLIEFIKSNVTGSAMFISKSHRSNLVQWFDIDELKLLVKQWSAADALTTEQIFRMCLFIWQYQNEERRRWFHCYDKHVELLDTMYAPKIANLASGMGDGYEFQIPCTFDGLDPGDQRELHIIQSPTQISGVADVVHKDKKIVIELKFSASELQQKHCLQTIGYSEMIWPDTETKDKGLYVCNLATGEFIRISPFQQNEDNRHQFHNYLSERLWAIKSAYVKDHQTN